jgi:hypothetical protein
MSATRKLMLYGAAIAAALSLAFCIRSILHYRSFSAQERASLSLQQELRAADAITDDAAADSAAAVADGPGAAEISPDVPL